MIIDSETIEIHAELAKSKNMRLKPLNFIAKTRKKNS